LDLQGIKSVDLSVGDLLKDFYVVPDYQREFVWTTNEVERLLQDIRAEYTERRKGYTPDYFIGTIVTNYQTDQQVFELIDGQQRVTTLYVFLVALRDYLVEMGEPLKAVESQLIHWASDSDGNEVPRHRVELQYEDSQDVVKLLVAERTGTPLDALPTDTRSAANLVQAYRDSRAFLVEELGGQVEQIKKFYAYVTQSVKLIRIRTESIDRALWIFETINERGRGLDAMDLLKNLLFRHAKSDQFEKLKQRWKALMDALYAADERPIGFIRYYILANHAHSRIQADRVYGWLTDAKNDDRPNYWDDPITFTNRILSAARAYVNFAQGRLEDGSECRYLKNMWYLSHTARQHLILLLAARSLPRDSIIRLSKEIENLYCVFLLTRQSANKFEKDFVDWAVKLRAMTTADDLDAFLEDVLIPERHALKAEFEFALRNLREENLPKYRLKYVLGKLAQHLDEIAYGPREMAVYVEKRIDIEHILPIGAAPDTLATFGDPKEASSALHRLANLTLLERSHNAVVSNKPFPEKQVGYAQSNFLLTKGLARDVAVGKASLVNEALAFVGTYDQWDSAAFRDREDHLAALAQLVWGTPAQED
jgi:Protein of unknown function DUF262/Protein of unknown function (DUF1524)